MKKIFYALSLAVALLTTSCTKDATEDILNGGNNGDNQVAMTTITVGIDNNQTRIHLGEEEDGYLPLYWSEGDVVYALTHGIAGTATASDPITAEDNGSEVATLKVAEGSTEVFVGVKQSLTKQNIEEDTNGNKKITKYLYIPSEQTYDNTKVANGHAIMLGAIDTETNTVTLKHVCGYMKVSLTGSATVKKVMLRAIGHEPISGYHKYTLGETTTIYDYGNTGVADGYYTSPVITINCGEGVALSGEATDFYFAIPEGNYSKGFALTVLDSNNKQQTVAAYKSSKEIKAGVMTKMKPLAVNCTNDAGIYDYNSFISFVRTLEKDCWIDNNKALHLYTDVNLKDFDRSNITLYDDLIYFRPDYTDYNNDDFTLFDGHNHTISDYSHTITKNKSALIFNTVLSGMTVQNLTVGSKAGVDADCSAVIKVSNTGGYNYTGTFSHQVLGKVINCTNNANTQIVYTKGTGCRFGAFSGNTDSTVAYIENCTNNGSITFTQAVSPTGDIQIGGIISRALSGSTVKNCINRGEISVTSTTPANTNVGGIVGRAYSSVSGCKNYASVSATDTRGANNTTAVSRVGGIVGSLDNGNSITDCTTSKDPNNASAAIPTITLSTNDAKGWNSVGGIVGYGSTENTKPNVIDSCTNHATVIFAGTGICRMGGISGQTGHLKNCTNYGAVKQTNVNCSAQVFVGGIGGSMHWNTENCHNYGDVSMVNGGSGDAGGMSGYTTTADAKKYTNCSVDCTVTAPKANNGGIYFGYIAEASITMTGCKAYGKVILAGTENTVTSENLSTLIFGENKNGKTIDLSNVTVESTKSAN